MERREPGWCQVGAASARARRPFRDRTVTVDQNETHVFVVRATWAVGVRQVVCARGGPVGRLERGDNQLVAGVRHVFDADPVLLPLGRRAAVRSEHAELERGLRTAERIRTDAHQSRQLGRTIGMVTRVDDVPAHLGVQPAPARDTGRWLLIGSAAVSAFGTVSAGVVFSLWSGVDDAITLPAREDATVPVYPANHYLIGALDAAALVALCTLLVASVWFLVSGRHAEHPDASYATVWHVLPVLWFAASVGACVPVTIHYSLALATPFVLSAAGAFATIRLQASSGRPARLVAQSGRRLQT
jgi:hypothetical protein